ncbi:hypothetical protein Gotri_021914, partial [Gossypium trilobum]|nr:hypothetical protein [Gossypium trilobum]
MSRNQLNRALLPSWLLENNTDLKDLGMIFPNLKFLHLSYKLLEGELPPSIGAKRKLLSLDLSFNNLSGEFPKELLGNDEFTGGLIPKKEFYAGMETFDVSNNKMTGKHPNGLAATTILLRANFRAK